MRGALARGGVLVGEPVIQLLLDRREWFPGEWVTGRLVITLRRPVYFDAVEAQLFGHELVTVIEEYDTGKRSRRVRYNESVPFLDAPLSLALVGVMTVAMFTMHGAIYLYLKTEGELQERLYGWMWRGFGCFLVCYLLATIATLVLIPRVTTTFADHPWAWSIVLLNILAIANIPRAIFQRRPGYAFLSSCGTIAALVCLFGMALYPNMVTSNPHPENSLTIYNAASSPMTQGIMAIIAAIGMPFVVTYTVIVYWTFRGKVQLGPHSY